MAQPNINIEKAKEKQIRNKERANFGNNKGKRKEREDNITIRGKQSLDSSKQKNSISTTSDKVHQRLNKLIDNENDKIIKTKQINEMEVIEVPEKLNDEGHENITLQKLIDFQEPKEKATISRTLRNIKMCKDQEEYDVLQDLNETKCNISFGQLLNVSPKVRSQVS
jgi:hypothetical protein